MNGIIIVLVVYVGVSIFRDFENFTTIKSLEKDNSFLRTIVGCYIVKYGEIAPTEIEKIITGGKK